MSRNLYQRAFDQEGSPIPVDHVVTVTLLDGDNVACTDRDFTRADTEADLIAYIGDFAAAMACEGTSGSVSWSAAKFPTTEG